MNHPDSHPAFAANCVYCAARPLGVCGALHDSEAFAELRDSRRGMRIFDAGAAIYRQGDPAPDLLSLVSGWAVQYRDLPDGRRQILRFLMPGALFGHEPSGLPGMSHGVDALTNASLCMIPADRMTVLRGRHPELNERFLWMLERDNDLAFDHLTSLGRRDARERVAHLLFELAVRSTGRAPVAVRETFKIPLNQLLIAEATGLTVIHVNRMLRRLREEQILEFRGGVLTVINPKEFRAAAGATDTLEVLWARSASTTPEASVRRA
jgi:CRP-like cAMP-binding protein